MIIVAVLIVTIIYKEVAKGQTYFAVRLGCYPEQIAEEGTGIQRLGCAY